MTSPPAREAETLHASTMVLDEVGILVRGPSGVGKTRLVMALVETGRREARFARLVADDRTRVAVHGSRLVARPHPALAGRVERRGLGILPVAHEPACVVGLVVDLLREAGLRLPEPGEAEATIAGLALPRLALPAATPAADAVSLVLARLAMIAPFRQDLEPFFLPRPPRCTR